MTSSEREVPNTTIPVFPNQDTQYTHADSKPASSLWSPSSHPMGLHPIRTLGIPMPVRTVALGLVLKNAPVKVAFRVGDQDQGEPADRWRLVWNVWGPFSACYRKFKGHPEGCMCTVLGNTNEGNLYSKWDLTGLCAKKHHPASITSRMQRSEAFKVETA
jgi:hypothetical protein